MREALQHLGMSARLPGAVGRYMTHTLTLDEARGIIRARLERRTETFLRIAERRISGHPGRPYLALLRLAGCELGDLAAGMFDPNAGLDMDAVAASLAFFADMGSVPAELTQGQIADLRYLKQTLAEIGRR